ncbi:MAG TPA: ABC transporter permease subunit [Chthoniobacterales bacterium]|nr:ABC transporter permease subunit [Chthoniobacterales bacterium]
MIRIPGIIATLLLTALVAWMGCDLFYRGASGLHAGYLFEAPRNLGRSGGIGPMLASTGIIVGLATLLAGLVSLPLAVAYTELAAPAGLRKIIRSALDIGVGVPRIVWGLFGAAFFGGYCGFGFSLLSGVLTLACLLAPIMTTGFITGLEMVENEVREQCAALGVDSWQTAWRQVVPVALPGLTAPLALAAGRGCGDAAALLFTAGVAMQMPSSLLDPGATLSVFVFHLLGTVPGGQNAAYSAAAVLFIITLVIQLAITILTREERYAQ